MTKNPLSFLFVGFRYLLHCFSASRLFDRCRFGRLSRRIFWETAAADAVVLLLTFFVPLEIAYRLQLEPESLFLRVWLCTWLILFAVLSVCLFRAARRRLHDAGMSGENSYLRERCSQTREHPDSYLRERCANIVDSVRSLA